MEEKNPRKKPLKLSALPDEVKKMFPRGKVVNVEGLNRVLKRWKAGKQIEADEPIEYFSMIDESGDEVSKGQKQTLKRFMIEEWIAHQFREKQIDLPFEELQRLQEEGPRIYYAGSLMNNPKAYPRLKNLQSQLGVTYDQARALSSRMKRAERATLANKRAFVEQALWLAKEYLKGHGIEGWKKHADFLRANEIFDGLAMVFVDMGNDTDKTLVYETDNDMFLIASPHEWLRERGKAFGVGAH
jgi:hypothetical protein